MGDQGEFLKYLLEHQNDVRAFIGSVVRDRSARDDVFQDVALILWRKFDTYDRERSFGAWARGIASHRIMQMLEKNRKLPVPFSPETIETLARTAAEDTTYAREEEALRKCMKKLPRKSRRLVALRYEDSMKLREMASELRTTLDAVHKALSRIRDKLRDCIERQLALEGGMST